MDLTFHKLKTKSKSPLWIFPQPSANSVALGVLVLAGTRDEDWPKEAGMAHALEHMHFEGTEKFPTSGKLSGYLEEVGGTLNAWTQSEITFYYVHVPAEHVKRGVEILSQQLRASTFPEDKIASEMNVIIQEIRRRNDHPSSFIHNTYNQLVYGNHPLGKDLLGTEESVAAFNREAFFNFKNRYYNSNNTVLIVAGRIEDKVALNLFDEFFSFVPGERNKRIAAEVPNSYAKTKMINKDIEQVHLVLGTTTGVAASQDASLLELFGYMISGGMSFPLFDEVRDKRGLCYEIHGGLAKRSDVGNFSIYIGTDPKRYKEAIDATLDVIQQSKSDNILLDRAKTLRIGRLALYFEGMRNVIDIAANDIAYLGAPRGYEETKLEIEKSTIDDIERVVDKYLSKDKISRAMLVPHGFRE